VNREAGIHVPIGKVSFTEEQLLENFYALMGAVIRARPASAKALTCAGRSFPAQWVRASASIPKKLPA